MRAIQWILDRLTVVIPFGLLAYVFAVVSEIAFRGTLGQPRPWPALADELVAASALATTALACTATCVLRLMGRPISGCACFSITAAVVTIFGITAWRPFYFFVF